MPACTVWLGDMAEVVVSRVVASDKPLMFDYTGNTVGPSVAKGYEIQDGGKTIVLHLRKGHKWSDGSPFTADDFVFWYTDVYKNAELGVGASADFQVNGVEGRIEKIDETTVAFKFESPYEFFVDVIAGPAWLARGQFGGAARGLMLGTFMPAHYLKQFLPQYTDEAELAKVAAERGFKDWRDMFKRLSDPMFNTELPVVAPWKTTVGADQNQWVLERNPYYYAVDTDGNQLPYVDRIVLDLFQDIEVANLKAIAGEVDKQSRHMDLRKLPLMLANRDKGNYDVRLDPNYDGASIAIQINMSYEADPEIAKWLTNRGARKLGV